MGVFRVLEPSMVGRQHITLIEPFLRALAACDLDCRGLALVYRADPSSHAALDRSTRAALRFEPISVINPETRRWIRKGLREFAAARRAIAETGPRDALLITCLTAPALLLLELYCRAIQPRNVRVVLHSELEALFDPSLRKPHRYGFWSWHWSRLRRADSRLGIAVIAGFIRDALQRVDPIRFPEASVRVLPFPVATFGGAPSPGGAHRITFVGYKTRFKGFESFAAVAARCQRPNAEFVVVGGGKVEAVPAGLVTPFGAGAEYMAEIARSSAAVFPYTHGYVAAQSAAALDAVAAGVHVIATRRPCFQYLQAELGDDAVTLYDSEEALIEIVSDDARLAAWRAGNVARRGQLANTAFSFSATRRAFAAMLDDSGFPVADHHGTAKPDAAR